MIGRWLPFGGIVTVFVGSAMAMVLDWPTVPKTLAQYAHYPMEVRRDFHHNPTMTAAPETSPGVAATPMAAVTPVPTPAALPEVAVNLPILLYHYPPADLGAQLDHLTAAGYVVVSLDQAVAGMHGAPLPAKPVVITFDDGFTPQTAAYQELARRGMPATFYIIAGGESSRWCIGAGRRYGDPLQPPEGCGDEYLNWDQIRALDRSGLITIAGHTVNHRNLAALSADEQRYEMVESKRIIEAQIGHPIHHLAYPYGAFTPETAAIAQAAGYSSAVTVNPGVLQAAGSEFTLLRERDAYALQ